MKREVAKAVISGSRSSYLKCPLSWTASPPTPSHILFVVTSFLVFLVMLASHSVTAHTMVRGTLHSSSAVLGVCMRVCVCVHLWVTMSTEKIAGVQEHWAPALSPFSSEWGASAEKGIHEPVATYPQNNVHPPQGQFKPLQS